MTGFNGIPFITLSANGKPVLSYCTGLNLTGLAVTRNANNPQIADISITGGSPLLTEVFDNVVTVPPWASNPTGTIGNSSATVFFTPIVLSQGAIIKHLACVIRDATAGNLARMGIYDSGPDGAPLNLLGAANEIILPEIVAGNNTLFEFDLVTPVSIDKTGVYFLAVIGDTSAATDWAGFGVTNGGLQLRMPIGSAYQGQVNAINSPFIHAGNAYPNFPNPAIPTLGTSLHFYGGVRG